MVDLTTPRALSVDFGQGFTNAWNSIVNIVPKLVAFAVILVIGWFIARAIERILDAVLRRMGSERVAEKGGMSRYLANSKYDTTGIICKIVYYAILLMALQVAFGVFGPNPISDMIRGIVGWLPRGIVAVVIVVVAMAIANAVRDIVTNALGAVSYGRTLGTVAWAFIALFGIFAALGQARIATSVTEPVLVAILAAIAGIAIVGVGGGLITPMRGRWERMLDSAERETVRMRAAMASDPGAYQKGRADALSGQPATPQVTQTPQPGQQPYGREPGTTA